MDSFLSGTGTSSEPLVSPKCTGQRNGKELVVTTENPFFNKTKITPCEHAKTFVMSVLLIPVLRLLLGSFCLLLMALCAFLSQCFLGKLVQELPYWRRLVFCTPLRVLARLNLFCLGFHWITVIDRRSKLERQKGHCARIMVANHVTFLDGMLFTYLEMPSIAVTQFVAHMPIVGTMIRACQPLLVDNTTREGRRKAKRDLRDRPRSG